MDQHDEANHSQPTVEAPPPETPQAEPPRPEPPRATSRNRARQTSFLPEVTGVDFPVVRRGYDRSAVDGFVEHVSQIVVELESNRSPDAVIERALVDVGEETSSIIRRARDAADEIVAQAQRQADEHTAQAEEEARRTRAQADRYREEAEVEGDKIVAKAQADAEAETTRAAQEADEIRKQAARDRDAVREQIDRLVQERHGLIENVRELGDLLHNAAAQAVERAADTAHPDESGPPFDHASAEPETQAFEGPRGP